MMQTGVQRKPPCARLCSRILREPPALSAQHPSHMCLDLFRSVSAGFLSHTTWTRNQLASWFLVRGCMCLLRSLTHNLRFHSAFDRAGDRCGALGAGAGAGARCRKVLHPAKSVQVSTETAHHTPKGQVDSETKPWWIQVDSSGFEWIRTHPTIGDCAPV